MNREYLKTRNRNRIVYYGAKELSVQTVKNGKYENLKQVSITFIFEENTTQSSPPIAKIQFTDTETKEVYTDLITLYEVNLNKIYTGQSVPENLIILKDFLSIKTSEALKTFVTTYDTRFSQELTKAYMNAILDDSVLLEIEGREKFMMKLTREMLLEERREGEAEGEARGKAIGEARGEARGKVALAKEAIILAIETGTPRAFIDALAKKADLSKEQVEELYTKAKPVQKAS
jgi:hypothetical protein